MFDAVLISKLMYGLDTMQLTKNELQKFDSFRSFHRKMPRRILGVPPTCVDRQGTNQKVPDTLLHRHAYIHHPLSNRWKTCKVVLSGQILRADRNDRMREVLFETGAYRPRVQHACRVGRPRADWLLETFADAFRTLDAHTPFDINNMGHINQLVQRARERSPPFSNRG